MEEARYYTMASHAVVAYPMVYHHRYITIDIIYGTKWPLLSMVP